MAQAVTAFQRQAGEWLQATKATLASAGLGFSADDLAEIQAAAQQHPFPAGHDPTVAASPEAVAQAQEMARKAMEAEYPPDGFAPDDPRLTPVEGVSLALHAIASKAIGWASDDEALTTRVTTALGIDAETYRRAAVEWTRRCTDDVVLATFYGQLFAQA